MKVLQSFCELVPSENTVIEGDTVSVQSFYRSSAEITNFQYAEFLSDLKTNWVTQIWSLYRYGYRRYSIYLSVLVNAYIYLLGIIITKLNNLAYGFPILITDPKRITRPAHFHLVEPFTH